MIRSQQEYIYAHPRGFIPSGDILPTRLHAENLVRAEDILFLREAVLERAEYPSHVDVVPFPGASFWPSLSSSIRGFFSGRFTDPSHSFTGGDGQFTDSCLPSFTPSTPHIPTYGSHVLDNIRKLDAIRRMFHDIRRLTRVSLPFTAVYSNGNSSSSIHDWSSLSTTDAGNASVSPTVDHLLSSRISVSGGVAIVQLTVSSEAIQGGYRQKWIPVAFSGSSIPSVSWSSGVLIDWARTLGYSPSTEFMWDGTATIHRIYFDIVYPAEINSLNWPWSPA